MSYKDPQQVIDNRYGIISQGIAQLLGETTKRLDAFTAQKGKERDAYNKVINKTKTREKTKSDTAYRKAVQAKDKFTQGLYGTSGEQTEEAVLFDDQINGIFNTWGTELNDQISEIQAGGGAESEVTDLTNAYIQKVNRFTTDMANWEAARLEYQKAKQAAAEGGYNSVGTLLSSPDQQRNPELISMFNAMTDDELDNLYITIDPSGNTRISMGTITDGNFDAQSTLDATAWATGHAENNDGKYFITNEQFDQEDYGAMEGLLGDLEANEALLVNGQLDRDLARDYLLNDELGRNYMDSFLADGGVNKWASLYPSEDMSRQYTDDDYLGQIFDNTWDSSYSHKQKKAKQSQRKKSGSSTTTTTGTGTGNKALIIPTKLNQKTKDTAAKIKPNTHTPEGKKTKEEREKHLSVETAKKESKLKKRYESLKKIKPGEKPPGARKDWGDKEQKHLDAKIAKEIKDIERQLGAIDKMKK